MGKALNECMGWGRDCVHGEEAHQGFDEEVQAA
jgi:hypothetical protein